MLNLTQRLILGCVLLGCLTVGLVAVTHKALAASGQLHLAYVAAVAASLIAAATIYGRLEAALAPRGVEPRGLPAPGPAACPNGLNP